MIFPETATVPSHILVSLALLTACCGPKGDEGDGDSASDTGGSTSSGGFEGTAEGSETDFPTGGPTTTADPPTTGDPGCVEDGQPGPQQDAWRMVVTALPFPPEVGKITIGRKEFNGNFANRGHVTVLFDHDEPTISVEMRVYDFTSDAEFEGIEMNPGTRDRIALWAFRTAGSPMKPADMPPEDDCTVDSWKDDCKIAVHFDGQSQPVRSGADLRVHLPRSYRGETFVETEDNNAEQSFPRPSDVTIDGLCGSGEVRMAAGAANVKLCRELTPAPTCAPADIAACENFKDEMGNDAAWSPQCPCPPDLYGQLKVASVKPWAANITVDIPNTTWINVTAANESPDKPNDCAASIDNCTPDICTSTPIDDKTVAAEFNFPSPAAASGAGYNLTALSSGCAQIFTSVDPADWCPSTEPGVVLHGNVRVCTDCL